MAKPLKLLAKLSLTGAMTLALTGCSYVFDTYNFSRDGTLYFGLVPGQDLPESGVPANCIQSITVEVADVKPIEHKAPDGKITKTYPRIIMWKYINKQFECLLKFPFQYGQLSSLGTVKVAPKQLQVGVTYRLNVTSRNSGHGGHTFTFK